MGAMVRRVWVLLLGKDVRMDGLTDVGAMVWRVWVRPDEPEIDLEAMGSRAWVVSRDPTIGLGARAGPMRVVPSEPDSGGPDGTLAPAWRSAPG